MHGSAFALFHNTPKIGILLHKEGFVESGKHCIQKIPSQASYIKFVRFFHRITIPYFMVIRYSRVPIPLQRALYDSRSHFHGNFFQVGPFFRELISTLAMDVKSEIARSFSKAKSLFTDHTIHSNFVFDFKLNFNNVSKFKCISYTFQTTKIFQTRSLEVFANVILVGNTIPYKISPLKQFFCH